MLAAELAEFIALGRRKGITVTLADAPDDAAIGVLSAGPLDEELILTSLQYATKNAEISGKCGIRDRLQDLSTLGTLPEQIQFIFGSGTYFFPRDVEHLARLSREAKARGEKLTQLPTRVRFETARFLVWQSMGADKLKCWVRERRVAEIFDETDSDWQLCLKHTSRKTGGRGPWPPVELPR